MNAPNYRISKNGGERSTVKRSRHSTSLCVEPFDPFR